MKILIASLAWVALASACMPSSDASPSMPPKPVEARKAFTFPPDFKSLRYGLSPTLSRESTELSHRPLAQFIGEQLGVPVELMVAQSYGDSVERMARGEYDLVELTPYALALARQRTKLRCLASTIANGSPTASGYIVVRDDSPWHSLGELKGTQFGFVDPSSTAGYLYAAKLLRDHGIDPTHDFATVDFVGNHEAALLAVLEGRIDAAATYQGAFAALKRSKGIDPLSFRVIGKTPRVPRDALCVSERLSPEAGDALQQVLLGLSSRSREGRAVLGPLELNGFQPPDERGYEEVRKVAEEMTSLP